MARKVKFPLIMSNGSDVRTIDELKESFDLESVLGYYANGKLVTWLKDRYYDEIADKIEALNENSNSFNIDICKIFGAEYKNSEDIDMNYIKKRNERLNELRSFTDDYNILSHIDYVAMNQDEMLNLLDTNVNTIYLYGEEFEIPILKENIKFIGINNPKIKLNYDNILSYEEKNIIFENVIINEKDKKIIEYKQEQQKAINKKLAPLINIINTIEHLCRICVEFCDKPILNGENEFNTYKSAQRSAHTAITDVACQFSEEIKKNNNIRRIKWKLEIFKIFEKIDALNKVIGLHVYELAKKKDFLDIIYQRFDIIDETEKNERFKRFNSDINFDLNQNLFISEYINKNHNKKYGYSKLNIDNIYLKYNEYNINLNTKYRLVVKDNFIPILEKLKEIREDYKKNME